MNYRFKLFLTTIFIVLNSWLIPSICFAWGDRVDDIYVDGNAYIIDENTRTAAWDGGIGDVIIPESFVYDGQTYTVTSIYVNVFQTLGYGTDDYSLITLTIPNSVTRISPFALVRCKGLTSVTMGNGLEYIGDGAFHHCTSLSSITIPSSVTLIETIENNPFGDCCLTSISVDANNGKYDSRDNCNAIIETSTNTLIVGCKNTVIPNCVTKIGKLAFEQCTGLTSVTIPNSVTSIGWGAFSDCTGLTSVTIPSSVTLVEGGAFKNTAWYNNQPDGLIYINDVAYKYKGDMPEGTSISIRNGTVSVSGYAFSGCTGLTSVTIPSSVASIGQAAFSVCTGLTSVTIPSSVTSIGGEAFYGCTGLTSIIVKGETPASVGYSTFNKVNKTSCTLYVPAGSKTAYENAEGWSEFQNIVEYTPGLDVLATGSCGDNVNYIIFSDMSMVISGTGRMMDFPYDAHINDEYYESIQELIIKEGVTSIGDGAFRGCISLTSVTIPNSVTSIGSMAFCGCTGLTSIEIPNSVASIGSYAFSSCSNLELIFFGNGLTSIGDNAFNFTAWNDNQPIGLVYAGPVLYDYNDGPYSSEGTYYDALSEEIIIKDGTVAICPSAFFFRNYHEKGDVGLFSFASITIPESLTYLQPICQYSYIFMNAYNICLGSSINAKSISVDPDNPIFDSRDNCNAIIETSTNKLIVGNENTIIPNGVTTIGAFSIGRLTSVSIPASVILIEEGAFSPMHLRREPELGGDIEENYLSSPVEVIKMEGMTPPIVGLEGVNTTSCTLYVPKGSKSAYENAEGWREFENIVEYEPDTDISTLDNAIYVEQTEGRIGGTKDISVKMKNDFDVRGFQFTMELPEGATIHSWTLNQGRMPAGTTMNKVFSTEGINENVINVVCALNDGQKTFTGNDGLIATVNVSFAEDMEEGSYPIYLTNNSISDATAEHQLELSDIKATLVLEDYVIGDTNGDGKVLVGDVIAILNYIVGSPSSNFNTKAADVNSDGKILIGDVIAVLNIIVNQ